MLTEPALGSMCSSSIVSLRPSKTSGEFPVTPGTRSIPITKMLTGRETLYCSPFCQRLFSETFCDSGDEGGAKGASRAKVAPIDAETVVVKTKAKLQNRRLARVARWDKGTVTTGLDMGDLKGAIGGEKPTESSVPSGCCNLALRVDCSTPSITFP